MEHAEFSLALRGYHDCRGVAHGNHCRLALDDGTGEGANAWSPRCHSAWHDPAAHTAEAALEGRGNKRELVRREMSSCRSRRQSVRRG